MANNHQLFSYAISEAVFRSSVFEKECNEGGRRLIVVHAEVKGRQANADIAAWGNADDLRRLSRLFLMAAAEVDALDEMDNAEESEAVEVAA